MKEDNKEPQSDQPKKQKVTSCESLTKAIPELPCALAVMILLCNIFFPPIGTFYMTCIGDKCRKTQIAVGALQLITGPFIIGYVWSIYWGIKTIKKSY